MYDDSSDQYKNDELKIQGILLERRNIRMSNTLIREFYKSSQPIYLCFNGAIHLPSDEEFSITVLNKHITLLTSFKIQKEIVLGLAPNGVFAQVRSLNFINPEVREKMTIYKCLGCYVYSYVPREFQHVFDGLEYDYVTFDENIPNTTNDEDDLSDSSFDIDDPDFALMFSNTSEIFVGACVPSHFALDRFEIEC